jgi:transposase
MANRKHQSATVARQTKARAQRQAKAHAKAQTLRQQDIDRVNALPITHRHAAGIDIGGSSHWVCVGFTQDEDPQLIREFPTHTAGLQQIVAFLREHQISTVAMESTGIYWVPLYELLQSEGFEVLLVDPSYTKQVKGRPKTDKRDAQWIYRLHAVGLLSGAFRPDDKTCQLRSYLRQRANLIRYGGQHVQHMQKALEQMNLKLMTVLSDLTGVTGQKILRAILRGTRDPSKLASYRHPKCQATTEELVQALTGSWREEHVFSLRQAYEAWQFYQKQIDKVEEQIQTQLSRMKADRALPPLKPKPRTRGRKPNDPRFDVRSALYYAVGLDLTEIEGIDEVTALVIISEIGVDLSKFETAKRFCSWLGLCPQFRKTGGKVKSSRTRPGTNRTATALRLAANSLHSSKSALGGFLRRMKSRLGAPAAITATAHKLARLVYYALKNGLPYVKKSQEEYERLMRETQIRAVKRKARLLGLKVTESIAEESVIELPT